MTNKHSKENRNKVNVDMTICNLSYSLPIILK